MFLLLSYVKITSQEGVGTIEFFHPQSNSLPHQILSKLAETIMQAGKDNEIKLIILNHLTKFIKFFLSYAQNFF